jgi:hypothetical protein
MLLQAWAQPAGVFHGSSLKVAVNDAGAVASVPSPITTSFSRRWWDVEVTDKHGAEMVNRTLPAGEWLLSNPPGASVTQGDHNEVLHIHCGSLGEFWFNTSIFGTICNCCNCRYCGNIDVMTTLSIDNLFLVSIITSLMVSWIHTRPIV